MLEYWTSLPTEFKFPKNVQWQYKTDTDLYEFAKHKAYPTCLAFSPDGKKMATIASDRKVRIFRFLTGKLMRVFDESLTVSSTLALQCACLPRRLAHVLVTLVFCFVLFSSDVHRTATDEAAAA